MEAVLNILPWVCSMRWPSMDTRFPPPGPTLMDMGNLDLGRLSATTRMTGAGLALDSRIYREELDLLALER